MTNEEQLHIEALLRTHKRRLQELEKRQAILGLSTPPEVLTEIEDIRTDIAHLEGEKKIHRITPSIDSATLSGLRRQARNAYFKKDWPQAVKLLTEVAMHDPDEDDIQMKLADARRELQLQEDYRSICDLRDEGLWDAVLDALADLERRCKGYPDTEGLRTWAENRKSATISQVLDQSLGFNQLTQINKASQPKPEELFAVLRETQVPEELINSGTIPQVNSQIQSEITLILKSRGPNKIQVMAFIKNFTHKSLLETKELVETPNSVVLKTTDKPTAEAMRRQLEEFGAIIDWVVA